MPAVISDDEDAGPSTTRPPRVVDDDPDVDMDAPSFARADKGKSRAAVVLSDDDDDDDAAASGGTGSLGPRGPAFGQDARPPEQESVGRRVGHDFNRVSALAAEAQQKNQRQASPRVQDMFADDDGNKQGKHVEDEDDDDDDIDGSDDDTGYRARPRANRSSRPNNGANGAGKNDAKRRKTEHDSAGYAWEASYNRSWDAVQEDESGGLQKAVEGLLARGRRRRAQTSQSSLRRSIIRHMYIILDLSSSMREKDMRPNRFDLTIAYVRAFVVEWFDQNPLGQLGIIGLRDGLAEMVVEMGGNPQQILATLAEKRKLEPSGEPSLQNGLDMARGSMSHLPSTSSLECLVLFSSLTTTDPGSIHKSLAKLIDSRVKVSVVALAAEMKVCRVIAERTGGRFGVAMDEKHYRELIFDAVQAPPTTAVVGAIGLKSAIDQAAQRAQAGGAQGGGRAGGSGKRPPPCDLMMMGFPTRLPIASPLSLCSCHSQLKRGGYLCPRCGSKICEVPTDCEVCGLMVVSSPHLARSYWFLFPVATYEVVPLEALTDALEPSCRGCNVPFPLVSTSSSGCERVRG